MFSYMHVIELQFYTFIIFLLFVNLQSALAENDNVTDLHHQRVRRLAPFPPIRMPYDSNDDTRYIELVMVLDYGIQQKARNNGRDLKDYCKKLINLVNDHYRQLNVFVALVGIVRMGANDIRLSEIADNMLKEFGFYRENKLVKRLRHDAAVLLTSMEFQGPSKPVGKAHVKTVCSEKLAVAVVTDHSDTIGLVSATVAHEIGHLLGMGHDNDYCQSECPKCIMNAEVTKTSTARWSSCSVNDLYKSWGEKIDYCLRNEPSQLFDSPTCGNGFVEAGEQCDCGLPDHCSNACCNPSTCMLLADATCATGRCCDIQTCRLKPKNVLCRTANGECDVPEYCDGRDEHCPADDLADNGQTCRQGRAYCYEGNCNRHDDQCFLVWGYGSRSLDKCYRQNERADKHGHCGLDPNTKKPIRCSQRDLKCGLLQCDRGPNEKPNFGDLLDKRVQSAGYEYVSRMAGPNCSTAWVELGPYDKQPGLVHDGTKCDVNMICLNQRCVPIEVKRKPTTTTIPSTDIYIDLDDDGSTSDGITATWIVVGVVLILLGLAVLGYLCWTGYIDLYHTADIVNTAATRAWRKSHTRLRRESQPVVCQTTRSDISRPVLEYASNITHSELIETRLGQLNQEYDENIYSSVGPKEDNARPPLPMGLKPPTTHGYVNITPVESKLPSTSHGGVNFTQNPALPIGAKPLNAHGYLNITSNPVSKIYSTPHPKGGKPPNTQGSVNIHQNSIESIVYNPPIPKGGQPLTSHGYINITPNQVESKKQNQPLPKGEKPPNTHGYITPNPPVLKGWHHPSSRENRSVDTKSVTPQVDNPPVPTARKPAGPHGYINFKANR